jgi:hypothetical protein
MGSYLACVVCGRAAEEGDTYHEACLREQIAAEIEAADTSDPGALANHIRGLRTGRRGDPGYRPDSPDEG